MTRHQRRELSAPAARDWGITSSISRRGNCRDNAVIESWHRRLKMELIAGACYATRAEARLSIFEYIEIVYNQQRRHSTLGYKTQQSSSALMNNSLNLLLY